MEAMKHCPPWRVNRTWWKISVFLSDEPWYAAAHLFEDKAAPIVYGNAKAITSSPAATAKYCLPEMP
jgi:hypothetical protein